MRQNIPSAPILCQPLPFQSPSATSPDQLVQTVTSGLRSLVFAHIMSALQYFVPLNMPTLAGWLISRTRASIWNVGLLITTSTAYRGKQDIPTVF